MTPAIECTTSARPLIMPMREGTSRPQRLVKSADARDTRQAAGWRESLPTSSTEAADDHDAHPDLL